jgi:hypothetical protein
MLKNIPFDRYEVYNNINENKIFNHKIILPYIDLHELNISNIYKPYEILETLIIEGKSEENIKFKGVNDFVLPIAILNKNKSNIEETDHIVIEYGKSKNKLEIKYKNRFHYLPIKSSNVVDNINIKSGTNKLAVGKPIFKAQRGIKNTSKLIVHIFVDAFAQSLIDKFGYEIIPNTKKYFEKNGIIFKNAYAQAEWTLSSIAGIFTGKYTHEHLIYHPRSGDKIKHTTLADALQKKGYLTFACTNIPKLTPVNGFDKGFDRYISAIDRNYNYIINEACEQLNTFGGKQYLFLGFFDIHEAHRLQPISSQVLNDLKDFQYKKLKGNSKDTSILYDEERINMLKNSVTHFDKKLQRLFDKIDKYDQNALVVMHSDHGVNFMSKTEELLGKEREKVVFLFKNNKKHNVDNRIKEIRELPSMITNALKIDNVFEYKSKDYAITESLYPNKDYEVAVRNEKYVLFFKVLWEDVKNRNVLTYIPQTSFHYIDKEEIEVDFNYLNNKHYLSLLDIAENCFLKISNKLTEKEKYL